jgi:ABC-type branched-subunit amino acid transport system substrate-binding protein
MIQPCAGDVETWSDVKQGDPYPKGAQATCRYPFWAIDDPRSKAFVEEHKKMVGFWPSYGAMNSYVTIYALKKVIEKTNSVDPQKLIKALEGMELDTFIGKILLRAEDHQAMMPNWYGTIAFTPDLTFPHLTDVQLIGQEGYHTIEQIKKLRK